MKNNIILKSWLILFSLLMISCSNEEIDSKNMNPEDSKNMPRIVDTRGVNKVLTITPDGEPISGVAIKKRGEIIGYSDDNGNFDLEQYEINYGDVLNFEHRNFTSVTKVIGEYTILTILMKRRGATNIIDSSRGSEITFMAGGSVSIPPNAFSFNGSPYDGAVAIRVTYIDITNDNDLRSAPGSYIALDSENNLYPLTSFGMLEVTAEIPDENLKLQLREGQSIRTAMPILTDEAPDSVNFYEFDERTGFWILKDMLQNRNNILLGQMSSVNRSWNADRPCSQNLVCVKIKVIFTNGDPGCGVAAQGLSYRAYDGPNAINSNGYVSFNVCPDGVFKLLSPVAPCPGPYFSTIIDLSTVTMNPSGCTDLGVWTINN